MKPEIVVKFISTLLHSRTQAHIFHLQTTSYAAHKALQKYYEDIVELIDAYTETYQGRYGLLAGYNGMAQVYEQDSVMKYFSGLLTFIDQIREELPQHGELNNTVDEISALVSSTMYKLKFLQ
jgi:hypothetical protein